MKFLTFCVCARCAPCSIQSNHWIVTVHTTSKQIFYRRQKQTIDEQKENERKTTREMKRKIANYKNSSNSQWERDEETHVEYFTHRNETVKRTKREKKSRHYGKSLLLLADECVFFGVVLLFPLFSSVVYRCCCCSVCTVYLFCPPNRRIDEKWCWLYSRVRSSHRLHLRSITRLPSSFAYFIHDVNHIHTF